MEFKNWRWIWWNACMLKFWFVNLIPNPFKQGHARMGQGDEYEVVNMTFKFEIKRVEVGVRDGNMPIFGK
jgi:hypothetical protein